MDTKKIGRFLKDLRNEQGIAPVQLGSYLDMNAKSILRIEEGEVIPDLDTMIALAAFYSISIEEILNGQRHNFNRDDCDKTNLKSTAYFTLEKERHMRNLRFFSRVGLVCWIVILLLKVTGLENEGIHEGIYSFLIGVAFAMNLVVVIYTSKSLKMIQFLKKKIHK